jgi:hypothetical protein
MTTNDTKKQRSHGLELEVHEVEQFCNPGCGSSTTSRLCTCPISATTTASLFTAKSTR